MKADERFLRQGLSFWAYVRAISERVGYTTKGSSGKAQVRVPSLADIEVALKSRHVDSSCLIDNRREFTVVGMMLSQYFEHRAKLLNEYVAPRLMNAQRAQSVFEDLHERSQPRCAIPMNKQRGAKRRPAYFTGIVNMLIEANSQGLPCDYDPKVLTTITSRGQLLRTLSRRVDGAFPSAVNPIAIWEIKEYYHTTTFGSRVADGVYETLLDGAELLEIHEHEHIKVLHYLMVDAYETWWNLGRSYLCRIIDLLHMGYIDEALFGYEVVERLPQIVHEWVTLSATGGEDTPIPSTPSP